MSAAVLDMSMPLDGFIAGPADDIGNGLGNNGHRLHAWLSDSAEDPARDQGAGGGVPQGPSGVSGEV